ncbi:MAG: hypothetical protein E6K81_04080 [Candidatus Eisenbacteria bacterium]|uniref:Tetratricopeptide repeat protein n=1 Tax=Eiseniibacteriota bacterium TaxID=2212470 RepID=A0A538UCE9_UNCEI|nr:MAG: hypothetical protein E6K81_04080 [Candidatus Eisenbacteria bacterium]
MITGRPRERVATVALVLLGLTLYARGLSLGFVGDDFILLDAARRFPLGELLSGRHGIVGFYRPVSRELYFWWWGRVLGLGPFGFHAVNALTFAAIVVMIERLARGWAGPRAGRLAAVDYLLFPPGSALLAWVSCAQDLIALFWALAAMLLYQRGRRWPAAFAVALAALSKETAVVMPLVLAAMDVFLNPGEAARARWHRLVAVWSPGQFQGAWRLPFDLARVYLPPDTLAGIGEALGSYPAMIVLAAVCAALAVPRPRAAAAGGDGAARAAGRAARAAPAAGDGTGPATPAGSDRSLLGFGLALALLALLPVGFVVERWRAYYFALAGVGMSLAAGVALARLAVPLAEGLLAVAAIVNVGAGTIYRPVESASGPARHPYANYAFFRETGALSGQLQRALAPWCDSLRAVPRTFAAGLPPDPVFASALGPGLRVTCRDTTNRVRFLADFRPADAGTTFGVLRFDRESGRFVHERADARVRARIGEGFLIHAQYPTAAACFAAAVGGGPAPRELSYPLVVALAAAQRGREAEAAWRRAQTQGAVLDGATLAARMLGRVTPSTRSGPAGVAAGATPVPAPARSGHGPPAPGHRLPAGAAPADSALAALTPLAAAALRAPWEAAPHRAFGRALLALGRAREATFELAVAGGISRQMTDLAWLGQGYEAMGALDEALAAYRQALTTGLPREVYLPTRAHLFALLKRGGVTLDRPRGGP